MSHILDIMKDERRHCYSVMLSMSVGEYLSIIERAYKNNGGIEGQRIPLLNKSALRIRNSMRKDIKSGTVLPPIVIGCTTEYASKFNKIDLNNINNDDENIHQIIDTLLSSEHSISIIDGMQRTTALKEIKNEDNNFDMKLRVELWITDSANNLIYRMLVLNTGQISWPLKKQLEVVFSHVSKEIKNCIPDVELIESNDGGKSNKPKKYQVSHLVELYLGFSTRKCNIKIGEKVAEEFAKQDIVEKSYNQEHLKYFIGIIEDLIRLDEILCHENGSEKRLFGDQNARLGFIVCMSIKIFGRASRNFDNEKIIQNYKYVKNGLHKFIENQKSMNPEQLNEYWHFEDLKELSEGCEKKELADYYKKAFNVIIEEDFYVEDMLICWNF